MSSLQSAGVLRALDPDLPFLASEVAVDIENLLANNPTSLDAIHKLAHRLRNAIEPGTAGTPPHSLMDPATLTVVAQAIAQTEDSLRSVDELLAHAEKIAASLSEPGFGTNRSELANARDFCVALSRAVVTYRELIYDLRPTHPFRR